MRREGLHFLIPDPTGAIDVVDLRRNPGLPTSLVLTARDHAVQGWADDYDGFCAPSGPVGGLAGAEAGPFVLRLCDVHTTPLATNVRSAEIMLRALSDGLF